MVAVPGPTPNTVPVVLTVAMATLLLLQVPPVVASVSVFVAPWQKVVTPEIVPAETPEITVTVVVAVAAPQLLVTV